MNESAAVKVCRLCLKLLFKENYFDINYTEPISGFMPFRDQITTIMPELALDIIPECYVCINCAESLRAAYEFKNSCLKVEDTIRNYFDNLPSESECDLSYLSKLAKVKQNEKDDDDKTAKEEVESVVKIIETQQVTEEDEVNKTETNTESIGSDCSFQCGICLEYFKSMKEVLKHKKKSHNSSFVCNFCNSEFKSLFLLRQHNTLCQEKETKIPWAKSSQKRPHLPAKAKNHLTEWLYHHQNHPYPTDYEKQCLMKETNLTLVQVENWFINARRRVLLDFSKRKRFLTRMKGHNDNSPSENVNSQ